LAQVLESHDPEKFAEALGHPDWDITMNEEYRFFNGKRYLGSCTSSKRKKTCYMKMGI
jgi:hypothetical protein